MYYNLPELMAFGETTGDSRLYGDDVSTYNLGCFTSIPFLGDSYSYLTSKNVVRRNRRDDESDGDFEGFSETDVINAEQEVLAAEERLRMILNDQGIGDDSDGDLNESENEDEGEQEVHIDERGDGGDGWHTGFDIFERGLPHLFTPRGNTGPSRVMGAEKKSLRFLATLHG
ncbi:Hypothetical predicted protein [Mytilus galloprovincialis]|uniref:Uncharacterized protein n=1 Tax=Mytilus galloprovincialis TaxID=29158 RepID=A0A8B6EV58_MYTGA|nr:Hypothetical predicted protein [Mytilus galloprovincialis]